MFFSTKGTEFFADSIKMQILHELFFSKLNLEINVKELRRRLLWGQEERLSFSLQLRGNVEFSAA
jgi:hypothetical protein